MPIFDCQPAFIPTSPLTVIMTTLTVGNYKLLITLNAADIVIRAEHQTNKRLYESTFTVDDFAGCEVFGGLEAVGRIVLSAFRGTDGASFSLDHERGDALDYNITVSGLVPITYKLRLFAKRREPKTQVAEDVEQLLEKCKELQDKVEELTEQVEYLEAARLSEGTITLPGCPVPIPIVTPTNSLELNDTFNSPENIIKQCQNKCCTVDHLRKNGYVNGSQFYITCSKGSQYGQHQMSTYDYMNIWFQPPYNFDTQQYLFTGKDIDCLCDMSNLETLIITNKNIVDVSVIGQLDDLTKLELHCPKVKDISWITKLTNLTELNLEGCATISDVSMCKSLPNLTKLNIKGTGVRNTEMLTSASLAIEK